MTGTVLSAPQIGDVVGPAAATDSVVAVYDGTTGKLLKNSTVQAAWFDQSVLVAASPTFANVTTPTTGFVRTNSLQLWDSDGTHQVVIVATENLAADRTLRISLSNADRTVTLTGDPTLADWFDQAVKVASSPRFAKLGIGVVASASVLGIVGLPTSAAGLAAGDVWVDTTGGLNILKIV